MRRNVLPLANSYPAKHWKKTEAGKVLCYLCPRNCEIEENEAGFCLVRANVEDELKTLNYGLSVPMAVETIETEAVYHYKPGSTILSLGNIGCMLSCKFCQNWETSQIKNLNIDAVLKYSPEQVVEIAKRNNIDIISWTYNDPVVWHEFVVETAKIANSEGIKNLYKSALYIESAPLDELLDVIDIFSVSLKSFSKTFYRKHTKGKLEPVLDGIEAISKYNNKHLEISQLVITGLNDDGRDARNTAKWIADKLGVEIPLHFVGFHPAYKYTDANRTSLEVLKKCKDIALKEGIKYVYIGNVYEEGVADTKCDHCGADLITRYGLKVDAIGISGDGKCIQCGHQSPIVVSLQKTGLTQRGVSNSGEKKVHHDWGRESNGVHVALKNKGNAGTTLSIVRHPSNKKEYLDLGEGVTRVIITRSDAMEIGIDIYAKEGISFDVIPLLDRAHYPIR